MNAICVSNLYRQYHTKEKKAKKTITAVRNISFTVQQGEIFGILGPNGAGKTTTIKMLTTLLKPTSGNISIFGTDILKHSSKIKGIINYMFGGERGLYERLTLNEYLLYFAHLYQLEPLEAKQRIAYLLKQTELYEHRDQKLFTFSKGMKQRVHLARCLLNSPKIIFLDEPTIGLDPIVGRKMRAILLRLVSEESLTVIITTHYMLEAEELCNRVAIINKGEIQTLDTPQNIKTTYCPGSLYEVTCLVNQNEAILKAEIIKNPKIVSINNEYNVITFSVNDNFTEQEVKDTIRQMGQVLSIKEKESTFEDAYASVIGSVST
ncbi:ABC transporter ATP-binding protein [Fictibacillus enclensis]|uniref:ABC transporter ATP-binding protein n=1 Tax=Fictibacillus enclensis TaxID=1017270 RepID=UPI0025A17127|nr:ABC transporter ATP-binding protein [Fictibacillus enclensis]MDM5335822.1 ABC transporter ATP-binding protein [Fictibacillus enclensis]